MTESALKPRARRGTSARPSKPEIVESLPGSETVGLYVAGRMGLLVGAKTKHVNAKVSPALFDAAAKRIGKKSPAAVINAALASLASEDDVGPWLARQWGVLADIDPELLEQIDL